MDYLTDQAHLYTVSNIKILLLCRIKAVLHNISFIVIIIYKPSSFPRPTALLWYYSYYLYIYKCSVTISLQSRNNKLYKVNDRRLTTINVRYLADHETLNKGSEFWSEFWNVWVSGMRMKFILRSNNIHFSLFTNNIFFTNL